LLSEREKMLSGELYNASDAELGRMREVARELTGRLNASAPGERDVREGLYRELFGSCGGGLWIEPPFYCDYGANTHLGANVFFNFNCVVLDCAEVRIGDRTLFGPAVQIYTATHPLDAAERRRGLEYALPITIGDDVWVGGGAIILPGVRIGDRAVIGAGSVVTKEVPAGVFAAGNPCRVVRELEGGRNGE
jgi:maltose O-acetyltransferase